MGGVRRSAPAGGGAARGLCLLLALTLLLLPAGCKFKRNLPFYQFDSNPDVVLVVDDVRYIQDLAVIRPWSYGVGVVWNFIGETGGTIGVCGGDDPERGGGFDVCPVEGDEEQNFFFVRPNHFVFGPYYIYFCIREDLQMMPPSAETVASVGVVPSKNEGNTWAEVDDPAMIAALFEAFHGDSGQTRNGEDWAYGSFTMRHKEYPFLQCEIKYCYSLEQEAAYCQSSDREWFPLPVEWYAVLSECGFPISGR